MSTIGEAGWRPTEVHPLAAMFPPLSAEDFDALRSISRRTACKRPLSSMSRAC
jgi:hypothetical protein